MPGFSEDTAANRIDHGPVLDSWEEHDGYTLEFVTFNEARDAGPRPDTSPRSKQGRVRSDKPPRRS